MYRERLRIELLYHDLKGPLAVIETGVTSLLKKAERYGPLNAKQKRVLQRALRNVRISQNLVNDTLELGRSKSGVMLLKPVKLSDLISDVLLEIFDLTNVALSRKIKDGHRLEQLQKILGEERYFLSITKALWGKEFPLDERKVKQILRNLLTNAIKYRNSRIALEVEENENCLSFSVTDDGKGIPPLYHNRILEGYFQLNDTEEAETRGHGLGLAGVVLLVEDMGGELFLESDVEQGAKFTVQLPVQSPEMACENEG
jgi:signal transduction histidine kinase